MTIIHKHGSDKEKGNAEGHTIKEKSGYLFTSEVGWTTKLTLIRKEFKYTTDFGSYTSGNSIFSEHILQEIVVLRLVARTFFLLLVY